MAPVKTASLPDFVLLGTVPEASRFLLSARLLGERIDTRHVSEEALSEPWLTREGLTIVFRDGVVVSITDEDSAQGHPDSLLLPHTTDLEQTPETEITTLVVKPGANDKIAADGQIQLLDASTERFLLVAIVLARSVMLSRDEILVAEAFDRISPLVGDLRENGQARLPIKQAMQLVGNALAARHRIMGSAQANDRPDLLWDHPELDRLYARLEDEYELDERHEVLERKFVALGDVAEVLLDIVRDKRAYRLELAIIALIAFEIVISLVDMALRSGGH
ncbi:RMD1 family protein [Novosphingobium terrae]|uniref:RMD1 family protein n=1 Tax=Novosphingobium terrae TaxID=2726189 RepID=UPI00197DDE4C|nr:RMD1 family protein [Novosphingobium terrae]